MLFDIVAQISVEKIKIKMIYKTDKYNYLNSEGNVFFQK